MERLVSVAGSTRIGLGFRCGETLGRGAWARAVSVGFRPYPWASGCRRWPAEREMGVYVCRCKFGVLLSSLPVLKATLGSGSGQKQEQQPAAEVGRQPQQQQPEQPAAAAAAVAVASFFEAVVKGFLLNRFLTGSVDSRGSV